MEEYIEATKKAVDRLIKADKQIDGILMNDLYTFKPSADYAEPTKKAVEDALQDWGVIPGLTFKFDPSENVNFQFKFTLPRNEIEDEDGEDLGTYAEAFFPNTHKKNSLKVFALSLTEKYIYKLKNVFAHELGHVMGLRHEFALTEGSPALLVGDKNPNSVMNYNDVPTIQESDKHWLKYLYDENKKITQISDTPIHRVSLLREE